MRNLALSVSALALLANPAVAQISALEIWEEWKAMEATAGGELTAGQQIYEGGTLRLRNVREVFSEVDANVVIKIDEIVLNEESDGSVSYSFSDEINMTATFDDGGERVVVPIQMTLEDYAGTITGDVVRHYVAQSGKLGINADASIDGFDFSIRYQAASTTTDYKVSSGTTGPWALDGGLNFMNTAVTAFGGDSESSFTFNSAGEGVQLDFAGDVSGDLSSPFTLAWAYGPGEGSSQTTNFMGVSESVTKSEGGRGQVQLAESYMRVVATLDGLEARTTDPNIPFPIEFTSGPWSTGFALPVSPDDTPQPLGFLLKIEELDFAEPIWSLFDPMGELDRAPINLTLDLDGTGRAFIDFFDTDLSTVMDAPLEINTLDIKDILLSFGGAVLSGDGDLVFENEASSYGPGIPQPIGNIELTLKNGFALLDKLVAIGILPAEQAQMGKMMSGMFTTPTGEDELTSKIEFTERGGILINGLPLPF